MALAISVDIHLFTVIDENGNCSVEDGYQLSSVVCHVLHPGINKMAIANPDTNANLT